MSLRSLTTQEEFVRGSVDLNLHRRADGTIENTPDNLFPNQYGIEPGTDGEPAEWDLSWGIEKVIAYHVRVSRPGSPRRASMTQQTTSPFPASEGSWTGQQPWVPGARPAATEGINAKPRAPEAEAVPFATRGYEAGTYAYAWGVSSEFGPTTPTGPRTFTLLTGEYPIVPIPESFPAGTKTWDIYMTRKNGSQMFLQRRIPINRLRPGGDYRLYGSWRNRGRPPATNKSGVGSPPAPRKNHDYLVMDSHHDILKGTYRPAVLVKNDRGVSLASTLGRGEKIKGSKVRTKVAGPGVQPSAAAAYSGELSGRPDPRDVRPSGKRLDREYLGQEIDFEESRLVSLINAERDRCELPTLVINAALNRAAENGTDPEEEGYQGRVDFSESGGNAKEVYSYLRDNSDALDGEYEAVGVARKENEYGWHWRVLLGDDPELPELDADAAYSCEKIPVEHVTEDGTVYSSEVQFADARLSFSLVSNNQMHYSYNGSFNDAVTTLMQRLDGMGPVSVKPGGGQVAITDGALDGAMARTYSDGRIILDSSVFNSATRNARFSAVGHEGLHGLGFDHVSVPSMLNTPIIINRTSNHESPTSYDTSEYRAVYGVSGGGGGGGGGGGSGSGSENPDPDNTEIRNPKQKKPDGTTETAPTEPPPPEPAEPQFHYEWIEGQYREKTALFLRTPKIVLKNGGRGPGGLQYTYLIQHESDTGIVTWYRAYPKRGTLGTAGFFDDFGAFEKGIEVNLYAEEGAQGKSVGLVQEDPPTEDTTIIEAPDPSSAPDEISKGGSEVMPAGKYLVGVQGVLESGALTRESEPRSVTIATGEMMKVTPKATVNLITDAEFSRLDANGEPEEWAGANLAAPAYSSVEEGVLTLGRNVASAVGPLRNSRRFPADPDGVITLTGFVGLSRTSAGTDARVVVRQLDEAGADLATITAHSVSGVGETFFKVKLGVGGTALDPATSTVIVSPRLVGTAINAEATFRKLRAVPFATDVRDWDPEEQTFDTDPDHPLAAGSFVAFGPPPSTGGPVTEPEPPVEVVGFDGGIVPAGWTEIGTGTGGVQAAAALFGTHGYRSSDLNMNARRWRYIDKTFSALSGNFFALRALYKFFTAPTVGSIEMHAVRTLSEGSVASLVVRDTGALDLLLSTASGTVGPLRVLSGIRGGTELDIEVQVVTGKNGAVSVLAGLDGSKRRPLLTRNVDFGTRRANRAQPGVVGSYPTTCRYDLAFDQVVITQRGDVLDRERPAVPTGYTPPPTDRPLKPFAPAWAAKVARSSGATVVPIQDNGHRYAAVNAGTSGPNEPAFPTAGGSTVRDNAGLAAVARSTAYALGASVLKPGGILDDAEWYEVTTPGTTDVAAPAYTNVEGGVVNDGTAVLTARKTVVWKEAGGHYRSFDPDGETTGQLYVFVNRGDASQADPAVIPLLEDRQPVRPGLSYGLSVFSRWSVLTEQVAPGVRVWLESDEPDRPPILASSLKEMQGEREWHPVTREDDYISFSVPLEGGYHHARFEAVLTPGVYVFDSWNLTEGAFPAFGDRDVKRGYGRALTGSGEWVMDLVPELNDTTIQPGQFVSEVGVKKAPDENGLGVLTAAFSTSGDRISYGPYSGPSSRPYRYMKAAVTLTSNGRNGAEIPAGGVFSRTWTPLPVLLRSDNSHFPGIAWVGPDLVYEEYTDAEFARVGGRIQRVPLSDAIGRLRNVAVKVGSEAARQEIAAMASEGEFVLEVPLAGGKVAGESYRVVFGGQPDFGPSGTSGRIHDGHRLHDATFTVEEFQVLERAPLQPPMLPISSGVPQLAGA